MADDVKLRAYYKQKFGFDPGDISPEKAKLFDSYVAEIETAQANPYVIGKKGWQENPLLVAMRERGMPRRDAQALSIWKAYRGGVMPEHDEERWKKGGVPADQIERVKSEREQEFVQRATSSYDMWARDEEQPATKKGKPMPKEEGTPKPPPPAPTPQPQPQAVTEQLPPAPQTQPQVPDPSVLQTAPPTFQAQISDGNGGFVPAELRRDNVGMAVQ